MHLTLQGGLPISTSQSGLYAIEEALLMLQKKASGADDWNAGAGHEHAEKSEFDPEPASGRISLSRFPIRDQDTENRRGRIKPESKAIARHPAREHTVSHGGMAAINSENSGAPEAREIPRHNGRAIRKTAMPAGTSWRRLSLAKRTDYTLSNYAKPAINLLPWP